MGDTELIQKAMPAGRRWRLFQFKCANSTLIVLFASITSTLNGKDWASMTGTQKLIAVSSIATLVCRNWESLIDKTFSEVLSNFTATETAGYGLAAKVTSILMLLQIAGLTGIVCSKLF